VALTGVWRLGRAVLHVLYGIAVIALRFPTLDANGRRQRIAGWSAGLLRVLGVALHTEGGPRAGATLLIANHVSWLDIAAIHASAPQARFVAKADVRRWPLIGWMVASAGTLFIERERRRDAMRVVHQMAQALHNGDTVAVFPEGTTSDGRSLLPFHANLLQAAIATSTPVQPVVLRFSDPQHPVSPSAEYIGDTTLLQSLWRIACAEGLRVHVRWLPAQGSAHADRRRLAQHLHDEVARHLA
jgi:1-acyl-sn-glycerol-3-phosphate acyltransferase